MRKIRFIDINVALVRRIFHLRFIVAGLTRKSDIINRIIKRLLFYKDITYFIPSDNSVTIEVNENIDNSELVVMPTDFIKEMINRSDDIVIMNTCLCRTSADCKDYPQDLGCIFLGKTTKKISRKYCHEATKEEAIEHIEKCNDAGLIHIMGRNKMDTVWMHVSPGDELLTICNCCPCCCLWRVYPYLSNEIQNDFYKLPGINVTCDVNSCVGCNKCVDVCFSNAINIKDNVAIINNNICIGCGQCSNNCPTNSITVYYNNKEINEVFNNINEAVNLESDNE